MSVRFFTIEPRGFVNAANVSEFQQQLTTAVRAEECSALLVDMKQVDFLDSAGLMALVSTFRLAQALNRRFSLCSLPPAVKMVFELTQLDQVFDIFDNRDHFEGAISKADFVYSTV